MLLEYSLGAEHSYLWAVTTDRVLSRELPARSEIEARARRVYESLMSPQAQVGRSAAEPRAPGVKANASYEKEAMALSRMLLGPVAAELGSKRLVIVADGALHYVPFGALPLPDGKAVANAAPFTPMIAAHEIVSVPSATVLALLREEASGRTPAVNAVAVLADPVFTKDDARVGVGPAARRASHGRGASPAAAAASPRERAVVSVRGDDRPADLPRLWFSRQEAESILAVMPQPSGLAALGFDANRTFAMSDALSQYRVIHFATHGLLDGKRPELSGLVLSLIDKAGRPQDGFLRLHEIYNLKLNAELVVLSACQTALGREVRGEGLIGLTRGFMYAGTPRVVASLWQVNDAATAQLMRVFYRRMAQEHLTPAAALRAAQLEIMTTHRWRAPYHWAAFVLQGEWR